MYLPARALILLYPRNPRFYFISLQSEKITGSTNLSPSREDYIRYIDRRGVQFSVFPFQRTRSITRRTIPRFEYFHFTKFANFSSSRKLHPSRFIGSVYKSRGLVLRVSTIADSSSLPLPSYRNRGETNGGGSRWPGETRMKKMCIIWVGRMRIFRF